MKLTTIKAHPVYVVEYHHQMLAALAELRRQLGQAPQVLTLDHHTDVKAAFARGQAPSGNDLPQVIGALHHDEHFDYALKHDLASRCVIVSHTNSPTAPADERITICAKHAIADNIPVNAPELRPLFDRALESDFLQSELSGCRLDEPYILDIDLDYFKTAKALAPDDDEYFLTLARGSRAITIAKEPEWVKLLAFDPLNAELALTSLLELLAKI